ncbi:MAG TPA: nuclear transport factor 2 family protein [Solirubrobacterales bacterium]
MGDDGAALVGRLFRAFNDRDAEEIAALCAEEMEFLAVTGKEVGRVAPYCGREGLGQYLADVEKVWEELRVTPSTVEQDGERLLVVGRVYVRSRELGIRDMPAGWIWHLCEGRFMRGEVFTDPDDARVRFAGMTPA